MVTADTARAERETWRAMIEHNSPTVCHTCSVAYGRAGTDQDFNDRACVDGIKIRQAWLDAFAANGHKCG
jgi:hypothetical protein